jgi:hypothetical protein
MTREHRGLVERYLTRCWLVLGGVLNCLQRIAADAIAAEPGQKQNIGTRKAMVVRNKKREQKREQNVSPQSTTTGRPQTEPRNSAIKEKWS